MRSRSAHEPFRTPVNAAAARIMQRTLVKTSALYVVGPRLIFAMLLAMVAASAPAAPDARPLVLEHLTTADGLPQGTVMSTLQDSQGFVWLGTEDGLVRFDGQQLLRYAQSRKTPRGLPGNFIYQIVEDAHHDLWLAIKDAGIARWNRATDTFTAYRHDPANPRSLASDAVRTLLIDGRGRVWVGTTDAGVDILEPASGRIEHLRHDPVDQTSLRNNRVLSLASDRSGRVWVGTETGLDRRQPGQVGFVHSVEGHPVWNVYEDRSGMLWVATFDGGLNRLDHEGQPLETFRHDAHQPTSLGDDDVRAILEDQAGHLWVGTANGLSLLDRSTGQFTHYRHDAGDAESLRDSFIVSLYEDPSGLVWIGTRAGGVSRWNPRSWELGSHRPQWLGTELVTAFADAPDNKVWIASLGGGLMQFDPDTGHAISVDTLVGRSNAVGDARVMSLRQDHRGNLWIGTMANGLRRLAPDGRLQSIRVKVGDPHSVSAAGIMTIVESRSGQIWVGTFGGGANVIDPSTGLIRQLPYGSATAGAISAANVAAIVEDSRGNLWFGTDGGGLNLARADGTVVKVFRHDPNDPTALPANTVYALAIDVQDRVWVATDGGGLALVMGSATSPESIHFRVITHDDGLSSDTIYGVVPDASGRLWLSGNAGLVRYEPQTGAIKTFHREHGLQGEEFITGAYHRLRDGRVCFGGPGGFNIFDPARLTENREPPRLALTGVEVLGMPAPGATPNWLRTRIALDHRASIISLDFGVLDFTSPRHNRLAYRISGLTDQWIDLGTQRRITLTNLNSGDHIVEVRAANSDSVWSATSLRLTLHRDPAPWRSWWAYTVYALAVLGLVLYRVHRQRAKFQEVVRARERLETEVEVRTHELRESNQQLAEAAQAKSRFLDRMSHELRTPMNGVIGMIELLTRTGLSTTQLRLTQTISSSAQVLLRIVNDLLDLSKVQAGKVVLEELPINLAQVLEECTGLFAGAAQGKGVTLVVRPPTEDCPNLRGDALRIRQILMNLIGNAVKFTSHGEIVVRAAVETVAPDRAMLRLAVTDTGIGMDEKTIGVIFQPFSQGDESITRRFGGTGLGLAICRELAELMGGTISVESRPQVGSTFSLCLPLKISNDSLPSNEAAPTGEQLPAASRPMRGHVLLVEDEAVNAAVAQGYLAELGCTCVWVKDGAEAVARSATERFDLIFMDLSMPKLDGFATTALIRQRDGSAAHGAGPRVPIVALSAHDALAYRDTCLAAGMDDILSKPYTLQQCAQLLGRWIANRADAANESLSNVDASAVAGIRKLRTGGNADLYSQLVDLFQTSSSEALTQLRSALEHTDFKTAAAVCHKLTSSAANVGALVFAKRVRELGQLCTAGDHAAARALHGRLEVAHPALIEELQNLRLRATA
jgi:signal transduction histidine kinase/ligand-binding sensor domain-containing protein/CheY-like chemotaxis protein/HPt (histidine-containing phosphotransfer) domain-containing protein